MDLGDLDGVDEEQLKQALNNVDDEEIEKGLQRLVNMFLADHFIDIRENAVEDYPNPVEVREAYKNMPDEEQQETFEEAMDHLLMATTLMRHRPVQGFQMFKNMLRDPTTTEALLLIFENEHIDEEYQDHLKEFAATRLHWLGVLFIPEMYTRQEAEPVLARFDPHAESSKPSRER